MYRHGSVHAHTRSKTRTLFVILLLHLGHTLQRRAARRVLHGRSSPTRRDSSNSRDRRRFRGDVSRRRPNPTPREPLFLSRSSGLSSLPGACARRQSLPKRGMRTRRQHGRQRHRCRTSAKEPARTGLRMLRVCNMGASAIRAQWRMAYEIVLAPIWRMAHEGACCHSTSAHTPPPTPPAPAASTHRQQLHPQTQGHVDTDPV